MTNKEVAFDYLRDRIVLGGQSGNLRLKLEGLYGESGRRTRIMMRGLHFAIVDEADSVLIDEARTRFFKRFTCSIFKVRRDQRRFSADVQKA